MLTDAIVTDMVSDDVGPICSVWDEKVPSSKSAPLNSVDVEIRAISALSWLASELAVILLESEVRLEVALKAET